MAFTEAEMAEFVDRVMADIVRAERAEEAGHHFSEFELDHDVTDEICDRLVRGPVRVRVRAVRSYWNPVQRQPDLRGFCDWDREGWVRRRPAPSPNGNVWAYVEDMTPGDDDNPTRYHRTHSLIILETP